MLFRGRPRGLKFLYTQEAGRGCGLGGLCPGKAPTGCRLVPLSQSSLCAHIRLCPAAVQQGERLRCTLRPQRLRSPEARCPPIRLASPHLPAHPSPWQSARSWRKEAAAPQGGAAPLEGEGPSRPWAPPKPSHGGHRQPHTRPAEGSSSLGTGAEAQEPLVLNSSPAPLEAARHLCLNQQ